MSLIIKKNTTFKIPRTPPISFLGLSLWLKADTGLTLGISQIIISGFTGIYTGANGTYNYNYEENLWYRSGGNYYINSGGELIEDSFYGGVIATNSNNFQGAWSPGNYFSTITFSNAGETSIDMNGVYTRSDVTGPFGAFTASGGRSINYDDNDGFWFTNGDFYRNYSNLNVNNWQPEVGDEPVPTAVNSTSVRNVGSPTSTTVADIVTAWADQSGNGFNANGNVAEGVNPTFVSNIKNGKPILRFGNNNDATVLRTAPTTFGNNGEFTIFTVHKYDNTNNTWAELISKGDLATEANSQFAISPRFIASAPSRSSFGVMAYADDTYSWNWLNQEPASTNWSIVCGTQSITNNSQKYFINGSLISESASVSAINQLNIAIGIGNGGSDSTPWSAEYGGFKGDLAEVIFYNRALTISERQQVEAYLNSKYQIY